MGSEAIPYIIGGVVTCVLAWWLLSRTDDRPFHSPSLYFSYSPDAEMVEELQRMFPTIPRPYVVRELDRAEGVMSVAIDALLLLNADFPSTETTTSASPNVGSATEKTPVTHQHILSVINSSDAERETVDLSLVNASISRKEWDATAPELRQRIIAERKKAMLVQARESFRRSREDAKSARDA